MKVKEAPRPTGDKVGGLSVRLGPSAPRSALSYPEALTWLYGTQQFGIKLGLESIERLIGELHVNLRRTKIIHVAGTNGKGSVCAMIDSLARVQGYRSGLFVSPHLVTFRERIRINGKMISKRAVASGLSAIRNLVANWDPHPTFFEITTALALKYFSEAKLDLAILETGLGGRLDATNAVPSHVSVITPIDLDHQKWLGQSISEIAREKAGIIKAKTPVVSAPQTKAAEEVIRARASEVKAPIQFVDQPFENAPIALRGSHQKINAAVAIAALGAAKLKIGEAAVARGLASVEWPARFQCWDKRTVIDGAHNPASARVLADSWREIFGEKRAALVLAVLSDKDVRAICRALSPITEFVLLPRIRSARALPPDELAKILSAMTPKLPYSITGSIGEALEAARARKNPILITGSLHFAGEVLAHLRGEPAAFEECAQ